MIYVMSNHYYLTNLLICYNPYTCAVMVDKTYIYII